MKPVPAALLRPSRCSGRPVRLAPASTHAEIRKIPTRTSTAQMFAFNDGLDQAVLEPVAKGYRAVTNEPIREGVSNFVNNLGEPVTFANEVLQGKLANAAGTVGRFVLNTTIGIAGIFDPAASDGHQAHGRGFRPDARRVGRRARPLPGPALPRLVQPARPASAAGADIALDPLNYAEFDGDDALRIGIDRVGRTFRPRRRDRDGRRALGTRSTPIRQSGVSMAAAGPRRSETRSPRPTTSKSCPITN